MALQYNYGICTNRDMDGEGNPCPLCTSKEKQKVMSTHDFVCRECGEKLTKVVGDPGGDGKWKYVAIAAGAVAVLGGGGYGLYSAFGKSSPEGIMLNHTQKTLFVGEKDTLKATITPEGCEGKLAWKTSMDGTLTVADGIVTANKEGKGNVRVVLEGEDGIKAVCEYTVKVKDERVVEPVGVDDTSVESTATGDKGSTEGVKVADKNKNKGGGGGPKVVKDGVGRVNLGYGSYYGELKNGVPHGHGTITYTRSTRIVNSKDFQAQRGDKFEGEFRNGKISGGMGYWYHNGDITAVRP